MTVQSQKIYNIDDTICLFVGNDYSFELFLSKKRKSKSIQWLDSMNNEQFTMLRLKKSHIFTMSIRFAGMGRKLQKRVFVLLSHFFIVAAF